MRESLLSNLSDLHKLRILQAATFVEDARNVRDFRHNTDYASLKIYNIYRFKWVQFLFRLATILHLLLAYIEPPATVAVSKHLPLALETLFLSIYSVDLVLLHLTNSRYEFIFKTDRWNQVYLALLSLNFLDVLMFWSGVPVRITRWFRPYYLIFHFDTLRACVRDIRRTLPAILKLLGLVFFVLILYTIFCTVLFFGTEEGDQNFESFLDGLFSMLVCLTNSNFPTVMIPAYQEDRLYGLIFFSYLIINMYFLMTLLLGTAYDSYRNFLSIEVKSQVKRQRTALMLAYRVLTSLDAENEQESDILGSGSQIMFGETDIQDVESDGENSDSGDEGDDGGGGGGDEAGRWRGRGHGHGHGHGHGQTEQLSPPPLPTELKNMDRGAASNTDSSRTFVEDKNGITEERFLELMYVLRGRYEASKTDIIFRAMDVDGEGRLNFARFSLIVDALNVFIRPKQSVEPCFVFLIPFIYFSRPSQALIKAVRHVYFEYFWDALIVLNIGFVVVYYNLLINGSSKDAASHNEIFDIWFAIVFSLTLLEVSLRIYGYGFKKFWASSWNKFDAILIFISLIVIVLKNVNAGDDLSLRILVLMRSCRCIRVISIFDDYAKILNTLFQVYPALISYGAIQFSCFYVFAMVGMQAFAGLIDKNNVALQADPFGQSDYYPISMNNFQDAMGTLFILQVLNNWDTVTSGYVTVTSKWARLYFIIFYIVAVIILLNIIMAFIMESFSSYWDSGAADSRSEIELRVNALGVVDVQRNLDEADVLQISDQSQRDPYSRTMRATSMNPRNAVANPANRNPVMTGRRLQWTAKKKRKVSEILRQVFASDLQIDDTDMDGVVDAVLAQLDKKTASKSGKKKS
eukprot:ANDGO_00385.mRNA.1 Two pore calcium channel protein 1B